MDKDILVVDGFCEYAEEAVASVKAAGFGTWTPSKGEIGSSVYEGMGFWGEHAALLHSIVKATGEAIIPNSMFFRYTMPSMEKAYIHSDRESGNYSCVAYLSDHDETYGTAFFKHKPTGLIHMPSIAEMREEGMLEELGRDMVSRDPDKWEQVGFVEGAYNRAVIFKAPLFHSRFPVEGIGSSEEDARLVWASHFFMMDKNGNLH